MASTTSSTTTRERLEATSRAFLSAFEEGGAQNDPSIINRDVTADCRRHMLPASIYEAFGLPADFAFDTTKFQETFAKDLKVMKFKNNLMSNLVIDTEARRAAFTSIAEVHPHNGKTYQVEQAWVLYFNEDGSKVNKVIEFCDKEAILKMANAST
ncbi:hypothetical protein S7711_08885 [Stachybotrys chartarum IBT 7711]|uniref:SnoaL-like domain-containing protein n=1 Tax=Stachybotrys chartarum (strain CBS 109288 / IBT 7711) TaxID=1280523 RepID=A0A084AL88_STACB|nr:hypothetical protein S7711_08885 [Stachybotrys chartarum IBT 7711]KFA55591.1 hypothetical protein S40293_10123 [Stachybotrys chartarum IBT 40293]